MDVNGKDVFLSQLDSLGLSDKADKFQALGWPTLELFAFAVPASPGWVVDAEVFNVSFIKRSCQVDEKAEEPPQEAALRELWFQAVVGDMRQRVDRTEDDALRKISQP